MEAFSGIRADSDEAALAACRKVLELSAIDAVLLTRGAAGMTLVERGKPDALNVPAETHRVFDVTGAGDTVVATIASALAAGAPLADAVRLANIAAGIVVAKPGNRHRPPAGTCRCAGAARGDGVALRAEAADHVRLWRSLGLKVGFTNGVFDLLHRGHLHSLEQAKRRCDRLVVGVNADASVRRLKGAGRPVQDETARAAVLAALRVVDLVVVFGEDTPEELIRALGPDFLFKGADYAGKGDPPAALSSNRRAAAWNSCRCWKATAPPGRWPGSATAPEPPQPDPSSSTSISCPPPPPDRAPGSRCRSLRGAAGSLPGSAARRGW